MTGSRLNVHLYRDSFNTPWGFRLQGGKDLNQPLTVQRVFSNSPAERELQRGDQILSINGRDTHDLTHKQAQDYIKHGGGQVQLIVHRPPIGSHIAPLSPPVIQQRPRAPSLQNYTNYSQPSRPTSINHSGHSPSFTDSMGSPYNQQRYHYTQNPPHAPPQTGPKPTKATYLEIQVQPPYQSQPRRQGQQSPYHQQQQREPDRHRSSYSQPPVTPTTPTPPWASQQSVPKRVTKLSQLGGGERSFGTDFRSLPRNSSAYSGQYQQRPAPRQEDYEYNQEEPLALATGPIPKVCSLRKLGGGGTTYGTSFGSSTLPRRSGGRRLSQPTKMPGAGGYGHMPTAVTMNRYGGGSGYGTDYSHRPGYGQTPAQRVQTTLDNITLSPRTNEPPSSSPFYQPSQAYQPGPTSPQYSAPAQASPQQKVYTPTALLLEAQRLEGQQADDGEEILPVWERRRQFQGPEQPAYRSPQRGGYKPVNAPAPASYGQNYNQPKQSTATWRPSAPQFKPKPISVNATPATYSPTPKSPGFGGPGLIKSEPLPWHRREEDDLDRRPAWRNTLKSSSGVKPWERDLDYATQDAARSEPFQPNPPPKSPSYNQPLSPREGAKVVHLQYNSPMQLYSQQNVAETLEGQTKALAGHPRQPEPGKVNQIGDRDWSQSAVLQFINKENKRGQHAPPTAPKPQPQVVYINSHNIQPQPAYYDDVGCSEF